MPPPSNCYNKNSTRSVEEEEDNNNEEDNNYKTDSPCGTNDSSSEDDKKEKKKFNYNGLSIVKSFLGPSFEDAFLRTFEFGKSLIQKNDDEIDTNNEVLVKKSKKYTRKKQQQLQQQLLHHQQQQQKGKLKIKEVKYKPTSNHNQINQNSQDSRESLLKANIKKLSDERLSKKHIVFTAKLNDDEQMFKPPNSSKVTNLSKIRSLDSDLKQVAPSPEKIKRQLEALIQINKNETKNFNRFFVSRTSKFNSQLTVMPTLCATKNQ